MSERMRHDVFELRRLQNRPWHSPPHWRSDRTDRYLFTAACYEHLPVIGTSPQRMADLEIQLISTLDSCSEQLHAWVILPNHYHFLVTTQEPLDLLAALGKLHGRTSFQWNGEDRRRGRKVWCHATETAIKSERHFWATLNYIHHNPVKHGFAEKWQDWPFSSARSFLEKSGRTEALWLWKEYPVEEYGNGWDD